MFKIANAISLISAGNFGLIGAGAPNMPDIKNHSLFSMLGGQFWLNIWVAVCNAVSSFFYTIVRWILNIVDFLQYFCKHLIGLDYWQKGNVSLETLGESDIIFKFLYDETVQKVFRAMTGIFVVLLIIFAVIAIVKNQYAVAAEVDKADNNPMGVLKKCFKAIFLVVLVPLMLVMGILASNAVLAGLVNALNANNRLTLGGQVFTAAAYDASRYRKYAENGVRYGVNNTVLVTVDDKTKKISTTVTPVTPKDFDGDDKFTGFYFTYKGQGYLYYVERTELKEYYNHYVKYFTEIMGVSLSKPTEVDAGVFIDSSNYPYAIQVALSQKSQKSALNKAAYNSWYYNSIYHGHSMPFDETVSATTSPYTADSGRTYSDAKKYTNNETWGAMHDGGANGLVALKDEYYVMADVIDFAVSDAASIAFVNIRSHAIDWTYAGKNSSGYLSSHYVDFDDSKPALNSFVVNYDDIGYVRYDAKADLYTAETDGAIYICAYYSASRGKFIPLVNGKEYVDDYGQSHKFTSDYLDDNYNGLVVARGILESEFSNQYGYPTEIDVDWSSASADGSISIDTPKYYTANAKETKTLAEVSSSPSFTFNGELVGQVGSYMCIKDTDAVKLDSVPAIESNRSDVVKSLPTEITYRTKKLVNKTEGGVQVQVFEPETITLSGIIWQYFAKNKEEDYVVFRSNKTIRTYDAENVKQENWLDVVVSSSTASETSGTTLTLTFSCSGNASAPSTKFKIKNNIEPDSTELSIYNSMVYPATRTDINSDKGSVLNTFSVTDSGNLSAKVVKLPGNYAHNVVSGCNEPNLVMQESTDSEEIYYYNAEIDKKTIVIKVTYTPSTHRVRAYANQTFKYKVDNAYLLAGESAYTARPYDITFLKETVRGGKTIHSYSVYSSNTKSYYYFEFEYVYHDSGDNVGKETYKPLTTDVYKVDLNEYNMFVSYDSENELTQLDPVAGENASEVKVLENKCTYVSKSSVYASYLTKDDGKYIWLITVNMDDKDGSIFGSFYTKTDSKDSINIIAGINNSYRSIVGRFDLEKVPKQSDVATGGLGSKNSLATTATVIFNRQTVSANEWRADLQIFTAIFTKNTFRFKIAFGNAFSASNDRTSAFQIINSSLKLDYNFTSSFASGLELKIFYIPMKLNLLILVFASCVLFSLLGKAVWGLIQRIFDITLYFVIMPGVASVIPFDGGGRFNDWSKKVVGKVMGAYGVMLGLNIFFILCPAIRNVSHLFTDADLATLSEGNFLRSVTPGFINSITELLFMLVALTMITSAPKIISEIVGFGADKEDVTAKGVAAKKAVKEMTSDVGSTVTGQKAVEAVKGFGGQLKNFVPGSAVYNAVKDKIKGGMNGKADADHIAQEAAEARRRADANAMYEQARQTQQSAQTESQAPEQFVVQTPPQMSEVGGAMGLSGAGADAIRKNAQQGTESALSQFGDSVSETSGAETHSETSGVAKYAEVAGSVENEGRENSLQVQFVNNEAFASGNDAHASAFVDNEAGVTEEFDTSNPDHWRKLLEDANAEVDMYTNNLQSIKDQKKTEFARQNEADYYGYDPESGKFIPRQFEKEYTPDMSEQQKADLIEDINDYNGYYDLLSQDQKDAEDLVEYATRDRDEIQEIINDLESTDEVQETDIVEDVEQEIKSDLREETSVKSDAGNSQSGAGNAQPGANSGQQYAEQARLYSEASRMFADASQGYADIASGKVSKDYGIEKKTKDQEKLDKLLAEREERLQKQANGKADTGLNVFQRSKAYRNFNENKAVEDSIFDANAEKVKQAAIEKWNADAGNRKIDHKLSEEDAKYLTETAISEWKDGRALELYNKKHNTNIQYAESLSKKQLAEARKLLDNDQDMKKAIARSEFKDDKIDRKIAKQQSKIALKDAGLYESVGKKALMAVPRLFSHKITDKEINRYQEKMDKWEEKGKRLATELQSQQLSDADRAVKEKELKQAQRRYDMYSAQLQNARGGFGSVFARELKSQGRAVKSELQTKLSTMLTSREERREEKADKMLKSLSTMDNFNWREYFGANDAVDYANKKYTDKQRAKLEAEASKIEQAKREKDLMTKSRMIRTDHGVFDDQETIKLMLKKQGKQPTNARIQKFLENPDNYKEFYQLKDKYEAYNKIIDESTANIRSMSGEFDITNRNEFAKRETKFKRATIARAKAERMKAVSALNDASRSGRLDAEQEAKYIEQIQGFDSTIDKLKKETFRYTKVRKAVDATKKFVGDFKGGFMKDGEKDKPLSGRKLARHTLATEASVQARMNEISRKNEETARKVAEKISKEEIRDMVRSDAFEREYINKIRRTLAQSGFAGNIKDINTTEDAKRIRNQLQEKLEKELLGKQSEFKKRVASGVAKQSELETLKLQEKLLKQRIRKLKAVDFNTAGLQNNVKMRDEIVSASERATYAKIRNSYKSDWNAFANQFKLKDTAKSGSSAYEKNMQWQKRLEGENKRLTDKINALTANGAKQSDSRIKTLTNQIATQTKMIESMKQMNERAIATAKNSMSKAGKAQKASVNMDKIMRDMRRQSKYKIKGLNNGEGSSK